MHARIMRAKLKAGTVDEAAQWWEARIARYKTSGLVRAYMLVDRATGEYLSITLWESEAAEQRNLASPEHKTGRGTITEKYLEATPARAAFEVVAEVG